MALGATVYTLDIDLSDSDRSVYETLALRVARHPQAWIDIGSPDASRLHKACKLAPRVAVYMHRDPAQFLRNLSGERIHRAGALELYALDRALVTALAAKLERRMAFALSINERELYLSIGDDTLTGVVRRCALE